MDGSTAILSRYRRRDVNVRFVAVLGVVLLLSFVLTAPSFVAAQETGAKDELTLTEAIRLAFEYDVDHEIARLQWDNARIDNLIAEAGGPISPYEQIERELQERQAENAYVTARSNLVSAVVQDYFDVKQAQHGAEVARRQAAIAQSEMDVVRQMVRIGERHPQDELREQNRVASAELAAETAERTSAARMAALLHRLGLSGEPAPRLVDEAEAVPFEWTREETLAYALEHSFSVWERDMNLRIAKLDLEALEVQQPAPLQLSKAKNNFRVTELNALEGDRAFRNNVTTSYYALTDAARRLEAAEVDDELAEAAHESARRQHEAGLTTDVEWERAQLDRAEAAQSRHDAVVAYVRARLELFALIGHPSELDPSEEPASR